MAELPERVVPAPEAHVVAFDWVAAEAVVAALGATIELLASQLEARAQLVSSLDDWRGQFRRQFGQTHRELALRAVDLLAAMGSLAGHVAAAAEAANAEQVIQNSLAVADETGAPDEPMLRGGPR